MQGRLAQILPLIVGWCRAIRTPRTRATESAATSNALMAFATENAPPVMAKPTARSFQFPARFRKWPALQASVASAAAAATFAAWIVMGRASSYAAPGGKLTVETNPPGAAVVLDGTSRGVTPLVLAVDAGTHALVVRGDHDERTVSLSIAPGLDTHRSFELKTAPPPDRGGLTVVTEPAGMSVSVDGKAAGKSPLTIGNLKPADHKVKVTSDVLTAERTVRISGGSVASVVFAAPKTPLMTAGWLTVKAPFDVQVLEGSDLIGRGDMAKIMLTAGRHEITLANQNLGYQQAQNITVTAGKGTTLALTVPDAMVSANARPWADVLVDGKNIGQTPIANLAIPIGDHEVVFRHPQLGERREQITVTRKGPNRISVDLTK